MMQVANLIESTAPEILVAGTPLPARWLDSLVSMRVELGLCLVGRTTLRFNDVGYALSSQSLFTIGKEVSIEVRSRGKLMSGIVTGASLEQSASRHPELVVTVDDASCRLGIGVTPRTMLNVSYHDAIDKLVNDAKLTLNATQVTAMTSPHDYLLVSGSNLAFLDTVARRCGCVWWVDDKTLHVQRADATTGDATVTLGQGLLEFSVRASGLRPARMTVNGWDAKAQQDIVGNNKPPPATATSDFVTDYLGEGTGKAIANKVVEQAAGDGNPNNAGEAEALASSQHADWHSGAVTARGVSDVNPSIKLLTKLQVANAGPSSGTYTVSQVEHVYRPDGFHTRFVAGPIRPAGLVDTLGPSAPDPGFTIAGLLTAQVSNVDDPDKLGRVKVKYAGVGGKIESAWARVVSLGGGASRGTLFHPEVNDEVLVGFERGDSRHPVVIGGLFSAKITSPADAKLLGDGKVNYRRIKSRLGHVIELADGTAVTEQHILLQLGNAQHKLRIGADKFEIVMGKGKPVSITSGQGKFEIDEKGNITIQGNKVTIKSMTEMAVEAQTQLGLKGTAQASLEGAQLALKGTGKADVQAGGPLTLKGATVMIN